MAAMTASAETPAWGSKYGSEFWVNHCFWEDCWPARYGWTCGAGRGGYYPAPITSCHGCWGAGYGCGGACYGCGGCWSNCYGFGPYWHGSCCGPLLGGWNWQSYACSGCYGCGGCYSYSCYGCYGGGFAGIGPMAGVGYAGGAYGNFGMYGAYPVPPQYGYGEGLPLDPRAIEVKPEIKLDVKPTEIKPSDVKPMEKKYLSLPVKDNASIVVRVPAGAKVYIDNNLMKSTATERVFKSPALEPGESYFYMVRAIVEKDGKEIEEVRKVSVRAGEKSLVAFDKIFDAHPPGERAIAESRGK